MNIYFTLVCIGLHTYNKMSAPNIMNMDRPMDPIQLPIII